MLHLATAALLLLVGGASAVPSSGGRRLLQTSPPPAFPPTPPFPPSTAGGVPCSNATNFTGTGPRFITGRYFDVLTLPTSCSSGVCRFGGLFCTDGSAGLAHYYNWTVPSGAVSGSSIISCWAAANARYCPASPALQYCEAASAPAPLCAITGTTAAPPHPPPPPPTPPAVQCASAVNVTNFTYVTGAFCTNATCPVGACQGKCNYGGLVCADGSVYAMYAAWSYPTPSPTGTTLMQCSIDTNEQYCPGSAPGAPGYCEPVSGGVVACQITGSASTPPPLPSPPPNPVPTLCSHATAVNPPTSSAWISGVYCAPGACPTSCVNATTGASACRYGGLVCSDGSVYAAYSPWTVPQGAITGQSLVQCSVNTNEAYCPGTTTPGGNTFCEASTSLFCVLTSTTYSAPPPPFSPPPFPSGVQCASVVNSSLPNVVTGTYCPDAASCGSRCITANTTSSKCNFGGLICADGSIYAFYYVPSPAIVAQGGAQLACSLTINTRYCYPGQYCEPTNGGVSGCTVTGVAPPQPPPPPPYPPAPGRCGTATNLSSTQFVVGTYCSAGNCGASCLDANLIDVCRFGGLICTDGSIFAFYNDFTLPAFAVTGVSNVACNMNTNPNYCPGNVPAPGGAYCEAGTTVGPCYIASVQPAPPPLPSPPPAPPYAGVCAHATNTTYFQYVSGVYCAPGACPLTCLSSNSSSSNKCNYGGLVCSDNSVFAMYYPFTPPPGAQSGTSVLYCNVNTAENYCPGSTQGGLSNFCEVAQGGAVNCVFAASVTAPPSYPAPLPPVPVGPTNICSTAVGVNSTYITGTFCSAGNCGPKCDTNYTRCRAGGLVCGDSSVYAFFNNVSSLPTGAVSGASVITCFITTNPSYCSPADGYCEAANGRVLGCSITNTHPIPPPPPPLPAPPPYPPASICNSTTNHTSAAVISGTFCSPGNCGGCPPDECLFGGLTCSDGSTYSMWYNWTQPVGIASGTTQLTCLLSTNPAWCPGGAGAGGYCESAQGYPMGCVVSGSVTAPNPPPSPPPAPPPFNPGWCTAAVNQSSPTSVAGYWCSPGTNGTCALLGCAANKCRYGGLVCADNSVYAFYSPFTPPPGTSASYGQESLVACTLQTNPLYCPRAPGANYCEAAGDTVHYCYLPLGIAPPSPPIPPLAPASSAICAAAVPLASATAVTGIYLSQSDANAAGCFSSHCQFGGLRCANGSFYAFNADFGPLLGGASSLASSTVVECYQLQTLQDAAAPAPTGSYVDVNPAVPPLCTIVTVPTPPSVAPPPRPASSIPPQPVISPQPTCATASPLASYTPITGAFCPPGGCGSRCDASNCAFGGIQCADGSVYGFRYDWAARVVAQNTPNARVSCIIQTDSAYCQPPNYCDVRHYGVSTCVVDSLSPSPSSNKDTKGDGTGVVAILAIVFGAALGVTLIGVAVYAVRRARMGAGGGLNLYGSPMKGGIQEDIAMTPTSASRSNALLAQAAQMDAVARQQAEFQAGILAQRAAQAAAQEAAQAEALRQAELAARAPRKGSMQDDIDKIMGLKR